MSQRELRRINRLEFCELGYLHGLQGIRAPELAIKSLVPATQFHALQFRNAVNHPCIDILGVVNPLHIRNWITTRTDDSPRRGINVKVSTDRLGSLLARALVAEMEAMDREATVSFAGDFVDCPARTFEEAHIEPRGKQAARSPGTQAWPEGDVSLHPFIPAPVAHCFLELLSLGDEPSNLLAWSFDQGKARGGRKGMNTF